MKKDFIVIYPGRFQPFHMGHKETYDNLVKKFGKENVYIATSDKVELPKSPFNFSEKKKIITTMFKDIPVDHVVQVKNPYQAVEIVEKQSPETAVIFVVGNKDAERLSTRKYYQNYKDGMKLDGYRERGYIYVAPENTLTFKGEPLSGSRVRDLFNNSGEAEKEELFKKLYGSVNKSILSLLSNKIVKESQELDFLLEGGAYGHLSHFHDVRSNTFGDLREFIDVILQGKMEYARLKTDGVNLMFSMIDGQLRGARNQGDLKNYGKNSLTIDSMAKKFEGRGGIQKAYVSAMKDLQHAIGKLPKQKVDSMFENGKNWMSVEVLHPEAMNVIPYNVYELRFHGVRKYDEKGNVTGEDKEAADKLAKLIKDVKQDKQNTYNIKSLEVATFPPLPDFKAQRAYFNKKVDHLESEYGMTDKNTISDVFKKAYTDLINGHAKEARYKIPKDVLAGLINRWAFYDKSFKIKDIQSIDNDTFKEWALQFDNKGSAQYSKEIANKFEYLTLELGARVLKNLSSFMVANPQKSVQELKKGIDDVVRDVQNSKNPQLIDKMKYELGRLSAIGGVNAIAPEEGVTFMFKDNFYKITGTFAPVNQLLGLRFNLAKEGKGKEEKDNG